jgi:hypothetical protein
MLGYTREEIIGGYVCTLVRDGSRASSRTRSPTP